MNLTYVTVAIPYVNADPHLGYAYELALADIHTRARRLAAEGPVRFLGGTDDYSLKNVLAAEAAGVPTGEFVDTHGRRFQALQEPLDLSFDDFIRTSTDSRHIPAVRRLWGEAERAGDLYRRDYQGKYCVGCEQFYDPAALTNGRCPEHHTPTEQVAETNWFFRLSRYQEALDKLISSRQLRIAPEPFRNEVLAFIRGGLADLSVSRSALRARGWGIDVPGDDSQVIYVWFDALCNYISALDYGNADSHAYKTWWTGSAHRIHVIGKGILRFHAVFWPAFLLSAGLPLPTRVQVHPYLTVEGAKLSKSAGAAVNPVDVVAAYGVDALRWWFARDVNPVVDTDFTVERLVARANEDLAGGVGNVVNRIVTLVHRYLDSQTPPEAQASDALRNAVIQALIEFDLQGATQIIVDAVARLNRDLEETKPWEVARQPHRLGELSNLLAHHLQDARQIAEALAPITPGLSEQLRHQLEPVEGRLPKPVPSFIRLDTPGL